MVEAGGFEPTVRKNSHRSFSERRLCFGFCPFGGHNQPPQGLSRLGVPPGLRELSRQQARQPDTLSRVTRPDAHEIKAGRKNLPAGIL